MNDGHPRTITLESRINDLPALILYMHDVRLMPIVFIARALDMPFDRVRVLLDASYALRPAA